MAISRADVLRVVLFTSFVKWKLMVIIPMAGMTLSCINCVKITRLKKINIEGFVYRRARLKNRRTLSIRVAIVASGAANTAAPRKTLSSVNTK